MKPIDFDEANGVLLGGPADRFRTEKSVDDLHVYRDEERHIISCWKASWRERFRFLITGRVWLWVLTPKTHPPIAVAVDNPFEKDSE